MSSKETTNAERTYTAAEMDECFLEGVRVGSGASASIEAEAKPSSDSARGEQKAMTNNKKPKPRKGIEPLTAFYCQRCKDGKHDGANHLPGICDCRCRP